MNSKESDVHTKLAVFLARRIVETEAKLMALETTVAQLCKVDWPEFQETFLAHLTEQKGLAQAHFQSLLEQDSELAWLAPEVSELLH